MVEIPRRIRFHWKMHSCPFGSGWGSVSFLEILSFIYTYLGTVFCWYCRMKSITESQKHANWMSPLAFEKSIIN